MADLAQYLVEDGIALAVPATTPDAVIGLLADRLRAAGSVRDSYGPAVIAREADLPTGLPIAEDLAVAVPHTDPEHVLRSGIALAILTGPVQFGSMDDPETPLPVRVVFALALKSKEEQLEMLKTIGLLLQDGPRLRRLAAATTAGDVRAILGGTDNRGE